MKDDFCNCYTCANSAITNGAQLQCLNRKKIVPFDGWCKEFRDYDSILEELHINQ